MPPTVRTFALALCALAFGACCFGSSEWSSLFANDRDAEAEARRYVNAHRSEFRSNEDASVAQVACELDLLAVDVFMAVATRGHSSGHSAVDVEVRPGKCFHMLHVIVEWTDDGWHGVGADAYDANGTRIARVGEPAPYEEEPVRASHGADLDLF